MISSHLPQILVGINNNYCFHLLEKQGRFSGLRRTHILAARVTQLLNSQHLHKVLINLVLPFLTRWSRTKYWSNKHYAQLMPRVMGKSRALNREKVLDIYLESDGWILRSYGTDANPIGPNQWRELQGWRHADPETAPSNPARSWM